MNTNPPDEIVVDAATSTEHEAPRSHARKIPPRMPAKPATQKERKERKERLDAAVADMTFKAKGNETRNQRSRTI
jgi:hypothetical protein